MQALRRSQTQAISNRHGLGPKDPAPLLVHLSIAPLPYPVRELRRTRMAYLNCVTIFRGMPHSGGQNYGDEISSGARRPAREQGG